MTPSLSVVIPVYNEPRWIEGTIADAVAAVNKAPFIDPEIIVVDDGSNAQTRAVLDELKAPFKLSVIHQKNSGRFVARQVGVKAAKGDLVLLLDARVSIRPDALAFVASRWHEDGQLPIWNAHVDIAVDGNPYARFWNVITELAFRHYFSSPRTTSFGPEEFDRFPKGTTCFLAPREALLSAIDSFRSYFLDVRNANDDTPIIRALAAQQRINISPGFSCLYRSRDSLQPFLRHAVHRGGVFVDGYGKPGTRFFSIITAFYPVSALMLLLAARRPRIAAPVALLAPLVGIGAGAALRRSLADIKALAMLGPLWAGAFASGMWLGLARALQGRARRQRSQAETLG